MEMLYKEQLDQMRCTTIGCDHSLHSDLVFVNPRCHDSAGVDFCYDHQSGSLWIVCHECKRPVLGVAVAEERRAELAKPPNRPEAFELAPQP